MSVIWSNAVKDTRMTASLAAIDIGGGGTLELCTSAYATVCAIVTLNDPSFTEASQALTLITSPTVKCASAGNAGTAVIARIKNNAGTVVCSGLSVGTSGTDIVLSSNVITAGEEVDITAGTITHG